MKPLTASETVVSLGQDKEDPSPYLLDKATSQLTVHGHHV